jgi:hypothetical protein
MSLPLFKKISVQPLSPQEPQTGWLPRPRCPLWLDYSSTWDIFRAPTRSREVDPMHSAAPVVAATPSHIITTV